jgi:hypothetical protein
MSDRQGDETGSDDQLGAAPYREAGAENGGDPGQRRHGQQANAGLEGPVAL